MKPLVSLLRTLYRGMWWAVVSVVVLMGLVVALARLGLPLVADYRAEVQQWLQQEFGVAIEIGAVEASWHGLHPKLLVREVTLLDPDGRPSAVRVGQAQVSLDLWATLRSLRPQPAEVELSGLALRLLRDGSGSIGVRGWAATGPTDWDAVIEWVLHHRKIHLLGGALSLEDQASGVVVSLQDADVYLLNIGDGHRLTAAARLSSATRLNPSPEPTPSSYVRSSARVQLAADLGTAGLASGKYYLSLEDLELALPPALGVPTLKTAALRLWADRLNHAWSSFAAELDTARIGGGDGRAELPLRASVWSGRRTMGAWSVRSRPLVQPARPLIPFARSAAPSAADEGTGLWLDWTVDPGTGHALELRIDEIRAEALAGLVSGNSRVSGRVRDKLTGIKPSGELRGLRLRKGLGSEYFALNTRFDALSSSPWSGIPGLERLSGGLSIDTASHRLTLQAGGGAVRFGDLFQGPWPVDTLQADLLFEADGSNWDVEVKRVLLENPDLALAVRGSMHSVMPAGAEVGSGDDAGPYLDLVASIYNGRAERVYPYLPREHMSKGSREWIDDALVAGTVTGGSAVFRGAAKHYPFLHNEGMFEVSFDVDDAIIDYADGWPRLEEVDAEVVFRKQDMFIHAIGGQIFDADMTRVDVHLPNLKFPGEGGRVLTVDGDLDLPVDEVRHFILNSPLAKPYGPLVESLETSGNGQLRIKLDLPLARPDQARVSGVLTMNGADLHWRRSGLQLGQVHGRLSFDGSGLKGRDIRARFLGLPARVTVAPGTQQGQQVTRIQLAGRLDQRFLGRTLGPPWAARASGQSRWRVTITTPQNPHGVVEPQVQLESDLRGLAIDLPAPIGKDAAQAVPFVIGTTLGERRQRRVWFDFGDRLGGMVELDRASHGLLRGELKFGPGQAALPVKPRLQINGRVDRLSIDDWIGVLESADLDLGNGKRTGSTMRDGWLARLHGADLQVRRLDLLRQRYSDLAVSLRKRNKHWLLDVDGDEIKGRLSIPVAAIGDGGSGEIVLDMDRLYVVPPGGEKGGEPPDPSQLPALRATVRDFRFDGLALGRLDLKATRIPSGVRLKPLTIDSPLLKVDADGRWVINRGEHRSRFQIGFSGPDLGGMFDQLGFAGTIKGGATEGVIDADWVGAPSQFELGRLNGTFDIRIGSGSLLQLDPGAGRLFALLSPQVLTRRMTTSGTELTGEGFSFEKIEGNYELRDGNAYTESLYVEGPVARIDISGRIGLLAEDYNQYVTVTPRVSGGMTVATGALAIANPPLGAVLLLAQTVFGDTIDTLGNRYYLISGKWEDPQVTRLSRPAGDAQ